jgi:light-regulated signal transduction histidine kinase (bacteriophytochrome)
MKIEIEEIKQANAALVHDLSNPISVVKMAANELSNIAAKQDAGKKPITMYVKMISEASEKLAVIVQNMQVFCGQPIESLVFTDMELEKILEETIQVLQPTFKKYNIPVPKFSASGISVYCEPSFLKVAFYNLIKELLDKSAVEIALEIQTTSLNSPQVNMKIMGRGIGPKLKSNLYDPVAIAKTILEKHRGNLTLEENDADESAVFKLSVPCST